MPFQKPVFKIQIPSLSIYTQHRLFPLCLTCNTNILILSQKKHCLNTQKHHRILRGSGESVTGPAELSKAIDRAMDKVEQGTTVRPNVQTITGGRF
jgi:hypothetical protein